jgi:hypothetical protein
MTALHHGVHYAHLWTPDLLRATDFYKEHFAVLSQARGSGYWLWKPYIVLDALARAQDGDVVLYADAGTSIICSVEPLVRLCTASAGVLLFAGAYAAQTGRPDTCRHWTKRDCFVRLDCDSPLYHDAPMADAAFLLVSKTPFGMAFVRDWLAACCVPDVLTDAPNASGLPDLPGFVDHRHDQSVLSLIARRKGVELHRPPSQLGRHGIHAFVGPLNSDAPRAPAYPMSSYPTTFFHHRRRALFSRLPPYPDELIKRSRPDAAVTAASPPTSSDESILSTPPAKREARRTRAKARPVLGWPSNPHPGGGPNHHFTDMEASLTLCKAISSSGTRIGVVQIGRPLLSLPQLRRIDENADLWSVDLIAEAAPFLKARPMANANVVVITLDRSMHVNHVVAMATRYVTWEASMVALILSTPFSMSCHVLIQDLVRDKDAYFGGPRLFAHVGLALDSYGNGTTDLAQCAIIARGL